MEKITIGRSFRVLAADDEPWNLEIIHELLTEENYQVTTAENGLEAWRLLEQTPDQYDVVILDRKMPQMDGIEVLRKMKAHPLLERIPVVFQTAQTARSEILEGLQAGAYYYLTKPYQEEQLLAIVKTAAEDFVRQETLLQEAQKATSILALMERGFFKFSTLEEGHDLAKFLIKSWSYNEKLVLGLSELFSNAVEHGNLGISYDEKSTLMQENRWRSEVNRRMKLPENMGKRVTVEFENTREKLQFLIKDQGDGFDWHSYLDFQPERAFDLHGRGVAIARKSGFDTIEYHSPGNEVLVVKMK